MNIRQALKDTWAGFLYFWSRRAEEYRQWMETPTPCRSCQKVYLYEELHPTWAASFAERTDSTLRVVGLPTPHSYCPACWKPIKEECARVRAIIREEYAKQLRLAEHFSKEARLVKKHNERAWLAGGEATLTIGQWIRTLEHYNWRCAYCGDSYEELEHRVPINLGGGTTAKNCVPSCQSCNRRKGSLHPDKIMARESSLSPEAHRRIGLEMEKIHGTQLAIQPERAATPILPSDNAI